jgi:hypothetical protein
MATVNKDFKIKSGLVVEGLQGTINGEVILTENAGDQYILDLIGGETLVKSVESTQLEVSGAGKLSVKANVFDEYGAAATAQGNAEDYADGLASNYDPAGSATTAENNAKSYADGLAVNYDAAGAATTAENNAKTYADGLASNYDPAGSASQALTDAQDYADAQVQDAQITSTTTWSSYKTSTEIGLAQTAAEGFATQAIANLVDSAPATLDTLNELAQALQDNPDIISDLQDIAAGKQDTLTAGSNIEITGLNVINVTGLDAADISDFNTAALSATAAAYDMYGAAASAQSAAEDYADGLAINYDAAGAAATAEQNAKDYADGLKTFDIAEDQNLYFTDARAKTSAADLLTGATLSNITITGNGSGLTITAENGVAGSTTTDLAEGTNLYFTDARARDAVDGTDRSFTSVELNSVAKQVAATLSAPTAGIQVAHAFAKADYRSAEYLVKVAYGTHTEISKVLLTLDSSDNIAITEYGIVGTNGSASSISAGISGANVQLQVTTANVNSTVTVVGTLLA